MTLKVNGQPVVPTEYFYPRDNPATKCAWSWRNGVTSDCSTAKSFDYLQTSQFVVTAAEFATHTSEITIQSSGTYRCAGFYWGTEFYYAPMGTPFKIPDKWLASAPLHMTVIPWSKCDGTPAKPSDGSWPDGTRALAVWVSAHIAPPIADSTDDCHFTKNNTQGGINADGPKCFRRPYWSIDGDYLMFRGSLVGWINKHNKNPAIPQTIFIDEDADLVNMPVNALAYRYTIENNTHDECAAFVAKPDETTVPSGCMLSNPEEITRLATFQINVRGFGRISGEQQLDYSGEQQLDYSGGGASYFPPTLPAGSFPLTEDIKNQAKFRVYSGLLVLSSNHATDYAITVEGITVGNGPKRFSGAVQLNAPYARAALKLTQKELYYDTNNFKVEVSDLKVVGNWIDASDGPEIMGIHSTVKSLYLHVNDDSIKVAVDGITISDVTLLQGATGGVVDLGSYGYNRGSIRGAVVDGVYVHRITHTYPYDEYNGLVVTRLCPVKPLNDLNADAANLQNATVKNLTVNKMGRVNTVQRPVAIGVLGQYVPGRDYDAIADVPPFCKPDSPASFVANVNISELQFLTWNIYPQVTAFSKLYQLEPPQAPDIKYEWGITSTGATPQTPSVAFFNNVFDKTGNNNPRFAVKMHEPDKNNKVQFYYVCGETGKCYDQSGKNVNTKLNVEAYAYPAPKDPPFDANILYPSFD